MRWSWNDLQELPAEHYEALVEWLNEQTSNGEPNIDMDSMFPDG
jgi:hypothetical protein